MRGHQILRESSDLIEKAGFDVVYGDTDSVFVRVGAAYTAPDARAVGQQLVEDINAHWRGWCEQEHGVASYLEMEFETHYLQFYLPTKRNSSEGSKKRYAGWVDTGEQCEVVVKGMEAVRTDWTPLAREFQLELFRRIFSDETDGLEHWVEKTVREVRDGERDSELVYTKKLRRHPDDYVHTPPHVVAAMKEGGNPHRISYVITRRGAEPVGAVESAIDYEHYVDRQLKPAVEGMLAEVGIDFERLVARQGWLW